MLRPVTPETPKKLKMTPPTTAPIIAKPMFRRIVDRIHGVAPGTMTLRQIVSGLAPSERISFTRSSSTSCVP